MLCLKLLAILGFVALSTIPFAVASDEEEPTIVTSPSEGEEELTVEEED